MDIIAICIAIFSFLLTALKYYLDYMKILLTSMLYLPEALITWSMTNQVTTI